MEKAYNLFSKLLFKEKKTLLKKIFSEFNKLKLEKLNKKIDLLLKFKRKK